MNQFREQDLSGAAFERVSLREATMREVYLTNGRLQSVDLSGTDFRGVLFARNRMRGVELVDVAPLVEAELDRRDPDRAKMRPEDPAGFVEAWSILERLWEQTLARARTLAEDDLHRSVDEEWSFIQTLRHLNFVAATWVSRVVLDDDSPWHPLDLPWDEAPGWEGVPWDREARPALDEVLAVRRERQVMVREVIANLTQEQLASTVTAVGPGGPEEGTSFPVAECLRVVLNEEWHHRLFADRDLTALETQPHKEI